MSSPHPALNVLFSAPKDIYAQFHPALCAALQAVGVSANVSGDLCPEQVDYIVFTPNGLIEDFAPFTKARAALSLWAGVDAVLHNPTLKMPLARMVDPGQREGMVEYVTAHVLRHHVQMDRYLGVSQGWEQRATKLARHRKVAMLGLGELGRACAGALVGLNFDVCGWSRGPPRCARGALFSRVRGAARSALGRRDRGEPAAGDPGNAERAERRDAGSAGAGGGGDQPRARGADR